MPGLSCPGVQALGGSPVLYGGGLWAAGQEQGSLTIPTCYWQDSGSSLAAPGSVIPQQQSLPPVPEASSVVVKTVGRFQYAWPGKPCAHPLISWPPWDDLG